MPSRWLAGTFGLCWVALGGCNALWGIGDLRYDGASGGGLIGGAATGAGGSAGSGGAEGGAGGSGGAGGVGAPCDYVFECPGDEDGCRAPQCIDGHCAWSYVSAGDPCSDPSSWCDGAGVCLSCGEASPPAAGASCPAICNGGCEGNACIVECTAAIPCWHELLTCPPGFVCDLRCEGASACANIRGVACTREGCSARCNGPTACGFALYCAVGPCKVDCVSEDACADVTVECGLNECVATCADAAVPPEVTCGFSCDCRPC